MSQDQKKCQGSPPTPDDAINGACTSPDDSDDRLSQQTYLSCSSSYRSTVSFLSEDKGQRLPRENDEDRCRRHLEGLGTPYLSTSSSLCSLYRSQRHLHGIMVSQQCLSDSEGGDDETTLCDCEELDATLSFSIEADLSAETPARLSQEADEAAEATKRLLEDGNRGRTDLRGNGIEASVRGQSSRRRDLQPSTIPSHNLMEIGSRLLAEGQETQTSWTSWRSYQSFLTLSLLVLLQLGHQAVMRYPAERLQEDSQEFFAITTPALIFYRACCQCLLALICILTRFAYKRLFRDGECKGGDSSQLYSLPSLAVITLGLLTSFTVGALTVCAEHIDCKTTVFVLVWIPVMSILLEMCIKRRLVNLPGFLACTLLIGGTYILNINSSSSPMVEEGLLQGGGNLTRRRPPLFNADLIYGWPIDPALVELGHNLTSVQSAPADESPASSSEGLASAGAMITVGLVVGLFAATGSLHLTSHSLTHLKDPLTALFFQGFGTLIYTLFYRGTLFNFGGAFYPIIIALAILGTAINYLVLCLMISTSYQPLLPVWPFNNCLVHRCPSTVLAISIGSQVMFCALVNLLGSPMAGSLFWYDLSGLLCVSASVILTLTFGYSKPLLFQRLGL